MKTTLNENIDIPCEIEFIEDEHHFDNIKYNVLKEMILPVVKLIESGINADEAINRVAKDSHLNPKIVL